MKFRALSELLWHFEEIPPFRPLTTMANIGGHVGGHRIQKKIIKNFFPLFAHQKEH